MLDMLTGAAAGLAPLQHSFPEHRCLATSSSHASAAVAAAGLHSWTAAAGAGGAARQPTANDGSCPSSLPRGAWQPRLASWRHISTSSGATCATVSPECTANSHPQRCIAPVQRGALRRDTDCISMTGMCMKRAPVCHSQRGWPRTTTRCWAWRRAPAKQTSKRPFMQRPSSFTPTRIRCVTPPRLAQTAAVWQRAVDLKAPPAANTL